MMNGTIHSAELEMLYEANDTNITFPLYRKFNNEFIRFDNRDKLISVRNQTIKSIGVSLTTPKNVFAKIYGQWDNSNELEFREAYNEVKQLIDAMGHEA